MAKIVTQKTEIKRNKKPNNRNRKVVTEDVTITNKSKKPKHTRKAKAGKA